MVSIPVYRFARIGALTKIHHRVLQEEDSDDDFVQEEQFSSIHLKSISSKAIKSVRPQSWTYSS